MSWIGLRKPGLQRFAPHGLDAPETRDDRRDHGGLMPRGTVLIDTRIVSSLTDQLLLSSRIDQPWTAGLRVSLDPHGGLCVTQRQGLTERHLRLPTDLRESTVAVTILFTWDAPARTAALSVEVPGTGAAWVAQFRDPLPPTHEEMRALVEGGATFVSRGVGMVAVADHRVPFGPLPSLSGDTQVETDRGPAALGTLRVGDRIACVDGGMGQVRWIGAQSLPAFDRFRPLRLKAPYFGATRDLDCAACQRLRFKGSAVGYLFDTHMVSARIGDLGGGLTLRRAGGRLTETYWQVLLDRPAPMRIGGLACESLDLRAILDTPGLLELSVLRDLPRALLPRDRPAIPRLQGFEARSLCAARAA